MLFLAILLVWIFLGSLALWANAKPSGANIIVGAAVLMTMQLVGVMLIAGLLNVLRRETVVGIQIVLNMMLSIWGRVGLIDALRRLFDGGRMAWREIRHSPAALVVLVIVVGVVVGVLALGWLLPPTDFDGLAQHIPIASFFLQNGNIAPINTPYRGILAYPASGSLIMAWSMLASAGPQALDLVQWPFWLLGIFALYQIARLAGASRPNALVGSSVFALAPIVVLQARASYVDLMLAVLCLVALALLVDRRLPTRWVAFSVGGTLGVMVGLKYAGLIYAILLGIGLLIRVGIDRRKQWRTGLIDMSSAILCASTLGGYWYVRNWLGLNNPVWPMTVQLGNWRVFEGVWTTATFYQDALPPLLTGLSYPAQLWTVWREPTTQFAADMRLGGLGPLWFAVGLPCLIVYLVQAIRQRDRLAATLFGFMFFAFVLTPANWHTRYVIAPVALSGVAIAITLEQLDRWPRRVMQGLALGLGLCGVILAFVDGPVSPADVERFARLPQAERLSVFADQAAAVKPAMRWFSQNVPTNVTVAYGWQGVVLYPFWEYAPQRRMVYVPPVDVTAWFDALRIAGAEYLIAHRASVEADFAGRDPRFGLLYADDAYLIYAIKN
jgi:hypothetical protein